MRLSGLRLPDEILFLGMGALLASAAAGAGEPPPVASVHARYVVLGERDGATVAFARAVIEPGLPCPALRTADGRSVPMTTRANHHGFSVLVCEAELPKGHTWLELADGRLDLPEVPADPKRILVLGDSGCDTPDPHRPGCAAGEPAEPLATMARAAAGERFDLLVHLGDLNYRGTSGGKALFTVDRDDGSRAQVAAWTYDAGDDATEAERCEQAADAAYWSQNAPNANGPDRWETWREDVFEPLAELLPAAPWVFVRGNHELCSRGGPGWFYFFDPGSALGGGEQRSCPESGNEDPLRHVVLTPPYEVRLGGLSLVVTDSANACDFFTEPRFERRFAAQYRKIAALPAPAGQRWLLTHRPLLAVTKMEPGKTSSCAPSGEYGCVGATLRPAATGALEAAGVDLVLAGHLHQFQALSGWETGGAPTLVVGTSGVELSDATPMGKLTVPVGEEPVAVLALGPEVEIGGRRLPTHAFLEMTVESDGWSAALRDRSRGLELVRCRGPVESGQPCRLVEGVSPGPAGPDR